MVHKLCIIIVLKYLTLITANFNFPPRITTANTVVYTNAVAEIQKSNTVAFTIIHNNMVNFVYLKTAPVVDIKSYISYQTAKLYFFD